MINRNVKELLEEKACNCVSVKDEQIYTSNLSGLKPILSKLMEDVSFFSGASVGDIIIGKAAALLLIYGKVEYIYAKVISEQAIPLLEKHEVPYSYDTLVPFIMNRNNGGMCPMEQLVMNIEEPFDAYAAMCHKVKGA